jgi:HlyD family secretion protein
MIRDTSAQDSVIAAPRKWRKIALWLTISTLSVAASVTLFSSWASSKASVSMARLSVAQVSRGTLVRDVAVNGHLVASISPTVYASAAGNVRLMVKAGANVKKGEIVAQIDSPEVLNTYKREQASVEQLEAEVARQEILAKKQKLLALRDAEQAEIERVAAERTYQRIEAAGVAGVIAKIDFLRAQDAMKSAQIRAKHAQAATGLEHADVDLALKTRHSQLQQQRINRDNAKRKVEELSLRAPVDGLVGTLAVADSSVVASNAAVMTLVDLSQLEVELEIPESYVAELALGMTVEMSMNGAAGSKLHGKLSALSPEVVKNQVLARVRLDGTQPSGLRQSQRVSARLLIEEKPQVLTVPRGPFFESLGGRFAYVLENGVAQRRVIQIGATSVGALEVKSGLREGEKVITSGVELFENAASVAILN